MDILDYRLDADLIKKRTRYLFNGLHVDIDKYISLRRAVVVEIEGNRRAADTLYKRMNSHVSS